MAQGDLKVTVSVAWWFKYIWVALWVMYRIKLEPVADWFINKAITVR